MKKYRITKSIGAVLTVKGLAKGLVGMAK